MNSFVSVIIPCYRQGKYLRAAIDSALAQQDVRVEVIVVNDGSDDDTETVAKSYGDRIKYIWRENGGLAAARNTGFASSSGEFIQFLDADDIILPTKFARQLAVFKTRPEVEVCYTNYRKVDIRTGEEIRGLPGLQLGEKPLEDFLFGWERTLSIPSCTALFRRRLWSDRMPFRDELRYRQDWVMWVEIALRGARFWFLDSVEALYRAHGESICADPMRMCLGVINASRVIREMIPPEYHRRFEEHAWHLADKWMRLAAFSSVPDYKRMYERAKARLDRIESSFLWRVALAIRRLLGLGYRRSEQSVPNP